MSYNLVEFECDYEKMNVNGKLEFVGMTFRERYFALDWEQKLQLPKPDMLPHVNGNDGTDISKNSFSLTQLCFDAKSQQQRLYAIKIHYISNSKINKTFV